MRVQNIQRAGVTSVCGWAPSRWELGPHPAWEPQSTAMNCHAHNRDWGSSPLLVLRVHGSGPLASTRARWQFIDGHGQEHFQSKNKRHFPFTHSIAALHPIAPLSNAPTESDS